MLSAKNRKLAVQTCHRVVTWSKSQLTWTTCATLLRVWLASELVTIILVIIFAIAISPGMLDWMRSLL